MSVLDLCLPPIGPSLIQRSERRVSLSGASIVLLSQRAIFILLQKMNRKFKIIIYMTWSFRVGIGMI